MNTKIITVISPMLRSPLYPRPLPRHELSSYIYDPYNAEVVGSLDSQLHFNAWANSLHSRLRQAKRCCWMIELPASWLAGGDVVDRQAARRLCCRKARTAASYGNNGMRISVLN